MKKLGRKSSLKNSDWVRAFANITSLISYEEVNKKLQETIRRINSVTAGKRVAYAWSGGKDSVALQYVCERAGIRHSMWGLSDLEYPEFRRWCEKNKPLECEAVNVGLDLEWLAKNEDRYLFPLNNSEDARWLPISQWRAQKIYCEKHNIEMLITGRRVIDNNMCGKDGISVSKDKTTYSPMWDWSHEEVLGLIYYFDLDLPPIYNWFDGWYQATHEWARRNRDGKSISDMWGEIYSIDPTIVRDAARLIESAKEYLTKRE